MATADALRRVVLADDGKETAGPIESKIVCVTLTRLAMAFPETSADWRAELLPLRKRRET